MIVATRLSRKAGPVCITLLAMRPAKSFWKKAQLWRTTCQWLCQRIMLATFTAIAWLAEDILRGDRKRAEDQQLQRHAGEKMPGFGEQLSGGLDENERNPPGR